jgi:hypothetical protein
VSAYKRKGTKIPLLETSKMWTKNNDVSQHPEVKAIRDTPDKYVDSWLEKRPFCWKSMVQTLIPSFEAEYKHDTTNGPRNAHG